MRESSAGRRRGVQTNGAARCSTAAPQAAPSWAAGASRRLRAQGGRGRGLRQAAGVRGGQGAEPSASRRRGAGRTRTREATSCPPILRGGEARERGEVSGLAAGVRPGRRGRTGREWPSPAPRLQRGGRGEVAPAQGARGLCARYRVRGRGCCIVASKDGPPADVGSGGSGRSVLSRLGLRGPSRVSIMLARGGLRRWSLRRLWQGACGSRLSALFKMTPSAQREKASSVHGWW